MALEIDYDTNFGILCRDAICVIIDTRCNKEIDDEGNKNSQFNTMEKYTQTQKHMLTTHLLLAVSMVIF